MRYIILSPNFCWDRWRTHFYIILIYIYGMCPLYILYIYMKFYLLDLSFEILLDEHATEVTRPVAEKVVEWWGYIHKKCDSQYIIYQKVTISNIWGYIYSHKSWYSKKPGFFEEDPYLCQHAWKNRVSEKRPTNLWVHAADGMSMFLNGETPDWEFWWG